MHHLPLPARCRLPHQRGSRTGNEIVLSLGGRPRRLCSGVLHALKFVAVGRGFFENQALILEPRVLRDCRSGGTFLLGLRRQARGHLRWWHGRYSTLSARFTAMRFNLPASAVGRLELVRQAKLPAYC